MPMPCAAHVRCGELQACADGRGLESRHCGRRHAHGGVGGAAGGFYRGDRSRAYQLLGAWNVDHLATFAPESVERDEAFIAPGWPDTAPFNCGTPADKCLECVMIDARSAARATRPLRAMHMGLASDHTYRHRNQPKR